MYTVLWSIQLCLLPLCRLVAPLTFRNILSKLVNKIPHSKSPTSGQVSTQLIRYTPSRMIVSLWMEANHILSQPLQIWQRINRFVTRLEDIDLEDVKHDCRWIAPEPAGSGVPSVVSSASPTTPPNVPATASQVYHTALVDNKTLDDLLASFDGERGLKLALKDDNQQHTEFKIRRSPLSRKYSVQASPSWPSRLGRRKVTLTEDAQDCPESYQSCHPVADNVGEGHLSDQTMPTKSESPMRNIPPPEHPGCTACEQGGSDSEQSVARSGKARPRFDTSKEPYHTVSKYKKTKLPRRTR